MRSTPPTVRITSRHLARGQWESGCRFLDGVRMARKFPWISVCALRCWTEYRMSWRLFVI